MKIDIIICTEKGRLENKSALLIETIKRFSGLSGVCIYSYSPREGKAPSQEFERFCVKNEVRYNHDILNKDYHDYPLANKPIVCAKHEQSSQADFILFIDSDTVFISEMDVEIFKNPEIDVLINPVDYHHAGADSKFQRGESHYWKDLYKTLEISQLRTVKSFVTKRRILEYYNSGFIMSRTSKCLFSNWLENFELINDKGIRPTKGAFFLEQSILSATISRLRLNVQNGLKSINYPVSTYAKKWRGYYPFSLTDKIHIHYHKIFDQNSGNVLESRINKLKNGSELNALIEKYLFQLRLD